MFEVFLYRGSAREHIALSNGVSAEDCARARVAAEEARRGWHQLSSEDNVKTLGESDEAQVAVLCNSF